MKSSLRLPLLALLIGAAAPAQAAGCYRGEPGFSGLYSMRGVMEVGSQIELKADGTFQYMLAYGAADQYAAGCWMREGQTIVLVANQQKASGDLLRVDRMILQIETNKRLKRRFDERNVGTYERR